MKHPEGYEIHYHLKHEEIMAFAKEYLKKKNPVIAFYWFFNIILIVLAIYLFSMNVPDFSRSFNKFLLGFAVFIPLIPLHELIHGISYKMAGASTVQYKAILKKMVFYAMADQFLTTKKAFVLLALAPFIMINTTLILLFFLLPEPHCWISYGALLVHTAGCSGDFALVSYFYTFWDRDPVTYDNVSEGESFFLLKSTK